MSDLHVCTDTTVLNQDPDHPMVGTIERCLLDGQGYEVTWSDGSRQWEQPTDLTLTASLQLRPVHDPE